MMEVNAENIALEYVPWANSLDSAGTESKSLIARNRLVNTGTIEHLRANFEAMMKIGEAAGILKKFIYYGKEPEEYLPAVAAHMSQVQTFRDSAQTHETCMLIHCILGLIDEVGEMTQALYQHLYLGNEFDRVNFNEELGDALWYMALGAKYLNHTSFAVIMLANFAKLNTRYGTGTWTQDGALDRDLDAERKALEGQHNQ